MIGLEIFFLISNSLKLTASLPLKAMVGKVDLVTNFAFFGLAA